MSTIGTEPPPSEAVAPSRQSRLPSLIRWAARITSIPVFAMLMISLVPSLMSFSLSTKEDKLVALALCAVAIGFLVAWRWPGVGGWIAILGVVVVLRESDASLFSDPFSLAFGLQALLFLISWAVSAQIGKTSAPGYLWVRRVVAAVFALAAMCGVLMILRGPGPTPLGKGREAFVGSWDSGTGFSLELTSDGRARVSADKTAKVQSCNTPVQPGESKEFTASFRSDDVLELSSGTLGASKLYHVDRRPFTQKNQIKMVLNGSDPYARTNGLVLIKRQNAEAKPAEAKK